MRAIFLDRDGVICYNRSDYVKSWQEFRFLPGAKQSLVALGRLGFAIVVVTNQSAVGRGIVKAATVEEIHRRMVAELASYGARVDRIFYCPHHPEAECNCRKPKPGLLVKAADEMGIDLSQSYMIGDAASDLIAGQTAGCRSILLLSGRGLRQIAPALSTVNRSFTIMRSLVQAAGYILKAEEHLADQNVTKEVFNLHQDSSLPSLKKTLLTTYD